MGRQYPRFLLCHSTTGKSKGPFIIHTLEPRFIAKPEFNEIRNIQECRVLEVWAEGYSKWSHEIQEIVKEIHSWWKYSGIHDSFDPRDQIISKLSKLEFLKDRSIPFTVEQAQQVIRIIFPTKAKKLCHERHSYGIKHDLERISQLFMLNNGYKYCSNETIKQALINEGFQHKPAETGSPNIVVNIVERELNIISKLGFYRVNHFSPEETF